MENKNSFLGYLHSFRGFAILCVVLVHAGVTPLILLGGFEIDESDPMFILNEVLFHDSTIFFALISGLLFSAILHTKGYERFYTNKFLYIFLPYLFFTSLLSMVIPPNEPGGQPQMHPDTLSYLTTVGKNLVFGKAMPIYWYLPVLFFLYLMTPMLAGIAKSRGLLNG